MEPSTEQIWKAFQKPLYAFIRRHVADQETAEDLLQDIFLKIHTNLSQLRGKERLESWIYQIACHLVINQYRRKKLHLSIEEAAELLPMDEIPEELAVGS